MNGKKQYKNQQWYHVRGYILVLRPPDRQSMIQAQDDISNSKLEQILVHFEDNISMGITNGT